MKNILYWLLISIVFVCTAHAEDSDKSMIAVAPDEELCVGSKGHFLPLPDVGSEFANLKSMQLSLDMNFGKECKLNGLLLKGRITSETFEQVRHGLQLLEAKRNPRAIGANTLWLDSPGGLISEALKIGDLIAQHGMQAIITPNSGCYSSCVLIYAAAATRGGIGKVGIHRPFSSEISAASLSYPEYLKAYEALTPLLKNYLSKYGVSPSIVDAMNVVPSDEIRILTQKEMDLFGLGFNNVAEKEFNKARTIQLCGQDYYEMHLNFHALIEACRKRLGISVLSDKDQLCWDMAYEKFPEYSKKFDECKRKKDNFK